MSYLQCWIMGKISWYLISPWLLIQVRGMYKMITISHIKAVGRGFTYTLPSTTIDETIELLIIPWSKKITDKL